jgi:hypothetical protein
VEGLGDRLHFRGHLSYDRNYAASPELRFQRRAPPRRGNEMAMKRLGNVLDFGMRWLAGVGLMLAFGCAALKAQEGRPATAAAAGTPPYNIVFVIVDQRAHRLLAGADYTLPAMDAIARHGVTFQNHYIASAMCSPSRAALLTGQPPQVNGVIDQMEYPYVTSLSPDLPNMGSVLKGLGYKTAYFGKFEMDKDLLDVKPTVNYSTSAKPYGFDVFSAAGDIGSAPESGYHNDAFIAGESVRWLRENAAAARRTGRPFFMVTGFLNPHDIMYADANVPGQPAVQIPVVPQATRRHRGTRSTSARGRFRFRRAFRNRSPRRACRRRSSNIRRAGTDGPERSRRIAGTCGPSSTTTTSTTSRMSTAASARSCRPSTKWICGAIR